MDWLAARSDEEVHFDMLPTYEVETRRVPAANEPSVQPFSTDLLPETLRPWVADIAHRVQCPPDYVAVTAIVTLSSLTGRQVGIRPKQYDGWTVVPNLWGLLVGRSSAKKSPAMKEAMKPLERLAQKARNAHKAALEEYKASELTREASEKHQRNEINKLTKQGDLKNASPLATDIISAQEDKPPAMRRYKTSDSTIEKLGELLVENPRGILICRDELRGFLNNLDKEGRESDRAFYIESWNGNGTFDVDRIGRGHIAIGLHVNHWRHSARAV